MYPGINGAQRPDHPAVVMAGSGVTVTHGELDARSNRLAQLLRASGLRPGDGLAVLMENQARVFELYWAAIRSGLYLTTINTHLAPDEAAYILDDCGAKAVVTSAALGDLAAAAASKVDGVPVRLATDGDVRGFDRYEEAVVGQPATPIDDEVRGEVMLYSSGTTGRPKGVRRPLSGTPLDQPTPNMNLVSILWGMGDDTVYLSPAPLYHAAPLGFTGSVVALGATVVVMERFDPVEAIAAIDRHSITHSQWVPTMFTRMLKLDPEERERLDGSTHRLAVHAAAPCPVEVKRQMINWWGPIINEYYAGTEGNGFVHCTSEEWLARPGTVGRSVMGALRICDDDGEELPVGTPGTIYFERDVPPFEYHNDPEKTRRSQHPRHPGWTTLGDVGYLDEEGYLFLTDRKTFMIISGGVNIYPQEVENELILHPDVADVAVFGIPHPEMGEQVLAVVQPRDGLEAGAPLEAALDSWIRERMAAYKVPRRYEFLDELPRLPTGKLYKRLLRDPYWAGSDHRI